MQSVKKKAWTDVKQQWLKFKFAICKVELKCLQDGIFVLLSCRKTGPINQINMEDWINVKGWTKEETIDTITAKSKTWKQMTRMNEKGFCVWRRK